MSLGWGSWSKAFRARYASIDLAAAANLAAELKKFSFSSFYINFYINQISMKNNRLTFRDKFLKL